MKTFLQFFKEQAEETVAILPGGYKPPTKGHFNALQHLLTDADRGIVIIGKKIRDNITPEQSKQIWDVYSRYTKKPIEVIIAEKSPVNLVYEIIDSNLSKNYIVGAGNKDIDIERFNYLKKHPEKYSKVNIVTIPIQGEGISGTKTRELIATDIDKAVDYFVPEEVKGDKDVIKGILLNK